MAKIITMNLFPVPLTIANFGNEAKELNRQLVIDALSEMLAPDEKEQRSGINVFQTKGDLETKYESFRNLADNLDNIIYQMLPKVGFNFDEEPEKLFETKQLWANIITGVGGFHIPHIHGSGDVLFSGVYYPTSGLKRLELFEVKDENLSSLDLNLLEVKPDEDIEADPLLRASSVPGSGDLVLFDPAGDLKRTVLPSYVNRYPYYGSEFTLTPRQSTLVIFPNYLSHMVAPVTEPNQVRISISFCFVKKA